MPKVLSKEKPDFGTYHHSTFNESEKIRKKVRSCFIETFDAYLFHEIIRSGYLT
jgi:hypothetical protein